MASEISHRHSATGETLYFTIRNVSRQMWNTAGTPNFETLTVANWTDYDIALTESPASSYFHAGTFPAISGNMVAGWYWCDVFKQAGASPAISDTLLASYFGYWDGTTYKWWADDTTHVGGTAQTARDLGAGVKLGNEAHGGSLATLQMASSTLGATTMTNASGVGLTITGSTTGLVVTGTASRGVQIQGHTLGLIIDGEAGGGVFISGTTSGLTVYANAGPALHVYGYVTANDESNDIELGRIPCRISKQHSKPQAEV